ncbi:outer membrane protein assembly factor BamA [Dinoroseobacter sp. PD6]|uniref:outer membrane protein assembly factor BamA n=1 Tax=Dinoroseobacter sp. PD6 TaxID=3028384 RepID=UPI00237C1A84|nr:outer membrane protein assembly factor BamA [Dinoroseobacter sp. PD6]MDD9715669.1 outer membrane protein assembly factor BamA [Dinoroseobacter sp. PD6]
MTSPDMARAQDFRFTNVEINGNQRIEAATILNFAEIARGETVTGGQLNDAFVRLQNSGLFESVTLTPRGNTLVIDVVEFPTINQVSIEGNRRLNDDQLLSVLQSAPRQVFTPETAEADAAAIIEAYQLSGRLAATVEPRIIRRSENRVDVVFEVTEGAVVENERISFVGNRVFSDRRLRRELATKQAGIFRQIIRADTFIEDRVAFDRQLLTDFYQARGYVDFQVLSVTPELSRERDAVFLTFNLREGQQFRFGQVTASSDLSEVDIDGYIAAIDVDPGEVYSPAKVDRTITRLERLALAQGLNFIRVTPRVTRNDAAGTLDLDFVVERGPRVFVERIDIEGNATTLDRVIRRQFDTVEGDPFNPREIREAAERIRALGFFSVADVNTRSGSTEDSVIVDVDVEEQPTGSLSFGGSFSPDDGFGLIVSLTERNFLGRGQTVSLNFDGTSGDQNLSFRFVEPSFLARDVSFSFSVGTVSSNNSNREFDIDRSFLDIGVGFPVSENGRLGLTAGYFSEELSDLDPVNSSPILFRETGKESGARIGYAYTFDTRRTGLNPNAGVLLRFDQTLQSPLGDNTLLFTEATAIAQTRVFNEEVLLRAALEGGAITAIGDASSRVTDRYFLSRRQMRGFASNGIGPRDREAGNEDALGGNKYVVARFEAEFPLGLPEEYGIEFGAFLDIGTVWDLDDTAGAGGVEVDDDFILRSAAGVSVFWDTAIGPLRFNFSRALRKEDYDDVSNFDFTVSTRF